MIACQIKFKRSIAWIVALVLVFLVSPVKAAEITDQPVMALSRGLDPVIATRLNSQTTLYEVESGDTLWKIARQYEVDWELILTMNDLRDTYLSSGQVLVIPLDKDDAKPEVYHVRAGDTLSYIAHSFGVSLNSLIAENNISNPDRLQIGQEIKIPQWMENNIVPVFKENSRKTVSRGGYTSLSWPLAGTITSRFGPRGDGFHHGLDIAAPAGTIISAAEDGKVVFAGWKNRIYGYTVIIDHLNGLKTMYSHNSVNLVKKGQWVTAGQTIAKVGGTGNATGPHVHFGVYDNDEPVDPEKYLKKK